jgi:hypothetical protein
MKNQWVFIDQRLDCTTEVMAIPGAGVLVKVNTVHESQIVFIPRVKVLTNGKQHVLVGEEILPDDLKKFT